MNKKMKMRGIALSVLAMSAVSAWAASVNWDYARNISATNDTLALSVVDGLNASGSSTTTVGNVTFVPDDGSSTHITVVGEEYTDFVPGGAGGTTPPVSAEYITLLDSARWSASSIILSNLVAGSDYTVQAWVTDARGFTAARKTMIGPVKLWNSVLEQENSLGQFLIGTFTADADTQTIAVTPIEFGGIDDPVVNAVALYSGTATFAPPPTDVPVDPAPVTWDFARNISPTNDQPALTPLAALNVGGTSDVTLYSTLFAKDDGSSTLSVGGFSYQGFAPGPTDPAVSSTYLSLLDAARYNASSVNIQGLTIGQEYTVQIWTTDARFDGVPRKILVDHTVKVWEKTKLAAGSLGQYVLGTFTANSTNQTIMVTDVDGAGQITVVLNAVAVFEGSVPFGPPPTDAPYDPATIAWNAPQWIADDSDVINTQQLVAAVNAGGTAVTLNGISFAAEDGSVTGSATWDDFLGTAPLDPAISADYQALLKPATYGVTGIALDGLVTGHSYTLQLWASDSRGSGGYTYIKEGGDIVASIDQSQSGLEGSLGQYITGTFIANGAEQSVSLGTNVVAVINAYALFENVVDPFFEWTAGYGLSGADAALESDPDADGLDNLSEYALNGNPTNALDRGTIPTTEVVDNGGLQEMYYVHVARKGDESLEYFVDINTDLIYGDWTNTGYVSTSGAINTEWDSVTNVVPMDLVKKYIRLRVER